MAQADHPIVAEQLATLRNDGKLWTCDIVTLELGYSARSLTEWQAIQSVQRLLPTAEISSIVTRRARAIQGALAETGHHLLPLSDLLIAAAAESEALELIHYDGNHETISKVTGQPTRWVADAGSLD